MIGSYGGRNYSTVRRSSEGLELQDSDGNSLSHSDEYIYRSELLINYQLHKHLFMEFEFRYGELDSNSEDEGYEIQHFLGRITTTF